MDDVTSDLRTPYDDPQPPAQLRDACRAAGGVLALPTDLRSMAKAASRPAPSLRFEDQPRGLVKRDIDMLAAADLLASALSLEID